MSEHAKSDDHSLVKVTFKLKKGEWHGHATESMWATAIGGDEYALRNVPFFAYDVSYGDTVRAESGREWLMVTAVIGRSGHSTYRLFVSKDDAFAESWSDLQRLGCSYERVTEHHYAVDVEPEADIYKVYEILEKGKSAGVWDFEEGHCGHALRRG